MAYANLAPNLNHFFEKSRPETSKELEVIDDITESINEDIVFITAENAPNYETNRPRYFLDIKAFDEDKIKGIINANKKTQLVYIIILPEEMKKEKQVIHKIRNVDGLSQIVLIFKTSINIRRNYMDGFYNIQFLVPNEEFYFQYYICMFCGKGKNEIEFINRWSIGGFSKTFGLEDSFKGNFFNATVNVSWTDKWISEMRHIVEIRSIISKYLHVKFNLIGPTDGVHSCVRVSGNQTKGLMNDLLSGRTEIIFYTCYGNLRAFTYADLPTFVEHRYNIILSVKPPIGLVWYSLFKPFDVLTWLLVILSVPISGATLYLVSKFKSTKEDPNLPYSKSQWIVITMICWEADSTIFNLARLRQRSIIGAYAIMAFLIIAAYQGTVVALLNAPQFIYPPVDTKEMFLKSDRQWLTFGGGHEWYFKNIIFKNTDLIKQKIELFKRDPVKGPHEKALEKLLESPELYVYFEDYRKIIRKVKQNYEDHSGKHPFHVSKRGGIGSDYIHFLVRKSSYLKKSLDWVLGALSAAGIYEHLENVELFQNEILGLKNAKKLQKNKTEDPKGITLKYLWIHAL